MADLAPRDYGGLRLIVDLETTIVYSNGKIEYFTEAELDDPRLFGDAVSGWEFTDGGQVIKW